MTVDQLIAELQQMPRHATVRVCLDTAICHVCGADITFAPLAFAEPLNVVKYEGQYVGLYCV